MPRYDDDDDQPVTTLDDLLGPVPETDDSDRQDNYSDADPLSFTMGSSVSDKNPSKSKRVRDYLEENPNARNRDIVEELAEFGVTAADVSNAKAQNKRKGGKTGKRGRPSGSTLESPTSIVIKQPNAPPPVASGTIIMSEIDAALKFVKEMGSLDRARQILLIIQNIKQSGD